VLRKDQSGLALVKTELLRLCLLALLSALLLAGCGSDESGGSIEIQADQLSLTVPDRIRQVQELAIETVEAIATVNGQQHDLTRTGEQFRGNDKSDAAGL